MKIWKQTEWLERKKNSKSKKYFQRVGLEGDYTLQEKKSMIWWHSNGK